VKWETHARPAAGVRPQKHLNDTLIKPADILIGLFWTKIGTSTGVAESGTVEEVDSFVKTGKPAMLYFSARKIHPNAIDLKQHSKLRSFKAATYKKAMCGRFASLEELRTTIVSDLLKQILAIHKRPFQQMSRVEEATRVTELLMAHRRNRIDPDEFAAFREKVLGLRHRTNAETADPPPKGEVGPNGGPIGYLPNGDKVEWLEDEDEHGKPIKWPMILRRNDKDILALMDECFDKVWWNRHQAWIDGLASGKAKLTAGQEPILKKAQQMARKIERKYGRRSLILDDFNWGALTGKFTTLRWVMGSDWEEAGDT
jgi:hypothetical protein